MSETHWLQDSLSAAWKRRGQPGDWWPSEVLEFGDNDFELVPILVGKKGESGLVTTRVTEWEWHDSLALSGETFISATPCEDENVCPTVPPEVLERVGS